MPRRWGSQGWLIVGEIVGVPRRWRSQGWLIVGEIVGDTVGLCRGKFRKGDYSNFCSHDENRVILAFPTMMGRAVRGRTSLPDGTLPIYFPVPDIRRV